MYKQYEMGAAALDIILEFEKRGWLTPEKREAIKFLDVSMDLLPRDDLFSQEEKDLINAGGLCID